MNPVSLSGRCADYVLKDHDNCVHVFVCGDMDSKVQRMMHSYFLEESAAVERIKETDKQRKKYYSYYTGGDWESASNYDLCLNTGNMSIEEAAEQILFYLKQKNIFSIISQRNRRQQVPPVSFMLLFS